MTYTHLQKHALPIPNSCYRDWELEGLALSDVWSSVFKVVLSVTLT